MKPITLYTIIIIFSLFFLFITFPFVGLPLLDFISEHWPVPNYQKLEIEELSALCKRISSDGMRELCLDIIKDDDFEHALTSTARALGYPLKTAEKFVPWYSFDYLSSIDQSLEGVKRILTEGRQGEKSLNPEAWCKEHSQSNGVFVQPSYYLCRAFLENPHFCRRMPWNDRLKEKCYWDAAIIWRDSSLCIKTSEPNHCYLGLVLAILSQQ